MRGIWVLVGAMALAGGCDDTVFNSGGGGGNSEYEADFTGVVAFFHDRCHECHPALIASFDAGVLEADVEAGTGLFVVAGDPDASLLWRVLNDADDDVGVMPTTGQRPDEEIAHVRQWILDGAPLLQAEEE
ncbi:MAG: hypothetical protein AB8H79_23320 [Myxococcota bacterium]